MDKKCYDNRYSCGVGFSSSCVGYEGIIKDIIKDRDALPCDVNINDIFKELQCILTEITDNTVLNYMCLANPAPFPISKWIDGVLTIAYNVKQQDLNQLFINKLCLLLNPVTPPPIDPTTILLPINMSCLTNGSCPSPNPIDLVSFCTQLLAAYCNLLAEVNIIKTYLNL